MISATHGGSLDGDAASKVLALRRAHLVDGGGLEAVELAESGGLQEGWGGCKMGEMRRSRPRIAGMCASRIAHCGLISDIGRPGGGAGAGQGGSRLASGVEMGRGPLWRRDAAALPPLNQPTNPREGV